MKRKRTAIYITMTVLLLTAFYFYFIGTRTSEKVAPSNTTESLPAAQDSVPVKGKDEDTAKVKKQPVTPPISYGREKVERSPVSPPTFHGDPVNLEDQSYSINNKKKETPITPGVTLEPGKSINIKIPGEDEIIHIQRDKTYHPGGYNVLWEKKY